MIRRQYKPTRGLNRYEYSNILLILVVFKVRSALFSQLLSKIDSNAACAIVYTPKA